MTSYSTVFVTKNGTVGDLILPIISSSRSVDLGESHGVSPLDTCSFDSDFTCAQVSKMTLLVRQTDRGKRASKQYKSLYCYRLNSSTRHNFYHLPSDARTHALLRSIKYHNEHFHARYSFRQQRENGATHFH